MALTNRSRSFIGVLLVLLVLGLGGWLIGQQQKNQHPTTGSGLDVVASFYPLGEFTKQVGGDHIRLTVITPAGAEPHDFEPSPQDILRVHQAKVFVYNGAGVDAWADRISGDLPGVAVVKASGGITLQTDPKDSRAVDPHIWLDPVLVQHIVDKIKVALQTADPSHASDYQRNAADFQQQLVTLDNDYRTTLSSCNRTTIVTSHAAFGYLAVRYHLEQIAIAGLSEEEPSAAELAAIAQTTQEKHVTTIFTESLASPKLAQTIATEVGAKTAVLNPVEGLSDPEIKSGKNYLSVMRDNLAELSSALSCHP